MLSCARLHRTCSCCTASWRGSGSVFTARGASLGSGSEASASRGQPWVALVCACGCTGDTAGCSTDCGTASEGHTIGKRHCLRLWLHRRDCWLLHRLSHTIKGSQSNNATLSAPVIAPERLLAVHCLRHIIRGSHPRRLIKLRAEVLAFVCSSPQGDTPSERHVIRDFSSC